RSAPRLVDEMQVGSAHGRFVVPEGVQLPLPGSPVERGIPVADELSQIREAGPGRPRLERRLVGEARAREALAQIGERGVGNLQPKRRRSRAHDHEITEIFVLMVRLLCYYRGLAKAIRPQSLLPGVSRQELFLDKRKVWREEEQRLVANWNSATER